MLAPLSAWGPPAAPAGGGRGRGGAWFAAERGRSPLGSGPQGRHRCARLGATLPWLVRPRTRGKPEAADGAGAALPRRPARPAFLSALRGALQSLLANNPIVIGRLAERLSMMYGCFTAAAPLHYLVLSL